MIFKREMKRNMKSLLIWSVILSGLILMMLSLYPQFAADQHAMNEMLDAYPEQLKKAFGMDTINFGTILGFYGVEVYMFTTLVGSVYAAMLASGILVKEESEKTAEFLLSKPITRADIVVQKLGAVIANLLLFNCALILASLLGFSFTEEEVTYGVYALLALATLLLHLTIASISFLLSSVMRKNRNIVSISLGIVFLSYALHIAAGVSDQLSAIRHISFFHYIDAASIIAGETIEPVYIGVMALVTALCIGVAFVYYQKKDIAA